MFVLKTQTFGRPDDILLILKQDLQVRSIRSQIRNNLGSFQAKLTPALLCFGPRCRTAPRRSSKRVAGRPPRAWPSVGQSTARRRQGRIPVGRPAEALAEEIDEGPDLCRQLTVG